MLCVNRLTKTIGANTILHSISFQIKPGEILALIGPNGAGKTTTIKTIVGLLNPSSGDIRVNNYSIKRQREDYLRQIGYIPDNPFFYEELTGRQFLNFTIGLKGDQNKNIFNDGIERLLITLEIRDFIDHEIHTYSLGMKKKLSLLISLISNPKYLIMDEPFNGLDPMTTFNIKNFLNDFTINNGAVLISTHMLSVAEQFCTHVAIIHKGNLVIFDSLKNLKNKNPNTNLESLFIQIIEDIERSTKNE
ncbi:MAG: ABC transporter ATP-binding protein [Sporolactobacillus sp.]